MPKVARICISGITTCTSSGITSSRHYFRDVSPWTLSIIMEFDSVTNRYYPTEHLKRLQRQRQQSQYTTTSVSSGERRVGLVRIMQCAHFDHLLVCDGVCNGVHHNDVFDVKIEQTTNTICGLPTFTVTPSPSTCIVSMQDKPAVRTTAAPPTGQLWFGGDGLAWSSDGLTMAVGSEDAVCQIECVGDCVYYLSSDTIGVYNTKLKTHTQSRGDGFRSFAVCPEYVLVSGTSGRMAHYDKQLSHVTECRLSEMATFKRMTILEGNGHVLGLTFSGDLLYLEKSTAVAVVVLGKLCDGVDLFASDQQDLVMVKSAMGQYRLFSLSDPLEDLITFANPVQCIDITCNDGLFSVILKI